MNRKQSTVVVPSEIRFAQSWKHGPYIKLVDARSGYKDGEPLRYTIIKIEDMFVASALVHQARAAAQHYLKLQRSYVKALEDALSGVSS